MIATIGKIYRFMGRHRSKIWGTFAFGLFNAVSRSLELGALLAVLNALVAGGLTRAVMWQSLFIMLASIAGKFIFGYIAQLLRNQCGFLAAADKRVEIGDRIKKMPMGYFNEHALGGITATLTTTLFDIENMAPLVLEKLFSGALDVLLLTSVLAIFDWRISLLVLLGTLCFFAMNGILQKRACTAAPRRQAAQAKLAEAALEYIRGMGVVKAFGLEGGAGRKIAGAIDDSRTFNTGLEVAFVLPIALQQMVLRGFSVVVVVASLIFYFNGTMALSTCLTMLVASFFVYGALETAGSMSSMLRNLDYSIDKVLALENAPIMDVDGRDIAPENFDIVCEEVGFSYEEKPTLRGISLTIPQNTTTAIVGPSGSGKTTLCHLISRFWDVNSGSIRMGGEDVRHYSLDALLKNISMVFQSVYLFNDTIENNIKFGMPDATRAEVIAAAKAAQCHDFIAVLPQGYDTVIGEGGATLSGGEKQRVSIARALLKDAPIIIFDEATANIDPENEEKLQGAIEALTHGKTIIMIAHRLKTVRRAHQIVVLDGGEIVQQGGHGTLIEADGIYRDFVQMRRQAIGWKLGT